MAEDKRSIVIELRTTGSAGEPEGVSGEENVSDNDELAKKEKNAWLILTASGATAALSVIKKEVVYEVNRNLALTEDYKNQVLLNNAQIAVNKAVSFGAAIAAGAIAGAKTGSPIGVAAGIIIGAGSWVGNEATNIYQRFDQAGIGLTQSNLQAVYGMGRLGLIDGGRGTLN